MKPDIDLNLMKLCGKKYWFVVKKPVVHHKVKLYIKNADAFEEFEEHYVWTYKWIKQQLILERIEIDQHIIEYHTIMDDEFSPIYTNNDYMVDTEEEADKLIEELNKNIDES